MKNAYIELSFSMRENMNKRKSNNFSFFFYLGKNNVFTALLTRKEFSQTELLIKSNFTRETIKLGFSSHLFPISLTSFVINNCEVGIEKLENGNLTQYKARLRSCEYQKAHERYFIFDLRYNSGDNVQMYSLDKNEPAFKRYSQYSKYATTYYGSEEKDVYYAILNFQALIADDITVENFRFLSVYDKNLYGDSDLSSHHWIYNL